MVQLPSARPRPSSRSPLSRCSRPAAAAGSSDVTAPATTTTQNGALAYARCMRSHGVPNFPDPTSSGGGDKEAVVAALQEVGNSKAEAAQTACVHVNGGRPGTGQSAAQSQAHRAAMLAFARCMRRRGFANFPDPSSRAS